MNKQKYLENKYVNGFIAWLNPKIDHEFQHEYAVLGKGVKPTYDRWECKNIFDAYKNYKWDFSYVDLFSGNITVSGFSFEESEKALLLIQGKLNQALQEDDESMLYNACCMVLDWGGVLDRGGKENTNRRKLKYIQDSIGLVSYFKQAQKILNLDTVLLSDSYTYFGKDNVKNNLLMNSGFTKIYSLLIKDFIIYDSRVGASLGLLVREFLKQSNIKELPEELCFSYGSSPNSKKCVKGYKRRDPSSENYRFPKLHGKGDKGLNINLHTTDNIKASWLIQGTLENMLSKSKFNTTNNPLRAFEAALFMIGNCIDCQCQTKRA